MQVMPKNSEDNEKMKQYGGYNNGLLRIMFR
jgi:hypothetical protein